LRLTPYNLRQIALYLVMGGVVACGVEIPDPPMVGERLDCDIVAVHSDYLSSSISLINGDGSVCADHVLHSGSREPGLAAALSGDVVIATGRHPDGWVTLIDRFPNGTITWLDPETLKVTGQLSVATGFAANPQDLVYVSRTKAYVSRGATNPSPTPGESDFDEGGDVLIVNPTAKEVMGRIDLHPFATSVDGLVTQPYPTSTVWDGRFLWVALGNQSADFSVGGEGRIVAIDTRQDSVVHTVDVPGLKNCTNLELAPSGKVLWGVCTGVFQEGAEEQLKHSGIFRIQLDEEPVLGWSASAASLGDRPFGYSLAVVDGDRVLALRLGDLQQGLSDELVLINRPDESSTGTGVYSGAYELGGVLWHPDRAHALVADANIDAPSILVVDPFADPTLVEVQKANPSAHLPPRKLRFFR
jgi:hypothetical protein